MNDIEKTEQPQGGRGSKENILTFMGKYHA